VINFAIRVLYYDYQCSTIRLKQAIGDEKGVKIKFKITNRIYCKYVIHAFLCTTQCILHYELFERECLLKILDALAIKFL